MRWVSRVGKLLSYRRNRRPVSTLEREPEFPEIAGIGRLEKDRRALARGVFTIRDAFATLPPWRADNASTEASVGVRPSPVPQKSRPKPARILGSPPASLPGDAVVGTRAASLYGTLHARDPALAPGSQGSTGTELRSVPALASRERRSAVPGRAYGLWEPGSTAGPMNRRESTGFVGGSVDPADLSSAHGLYGVDQTLGAAG